MRGPSPSERVLRQQLEAENRELRKMVAELAAGIDQLTQLIESKTGRALTSSRRVAKRKAAEQLIQRQTGNSKARRRS